VPDLLLADEIEQPAVDRMAGKGLEGERRDELLGVFRHHHEDLGPGLGQQAQQFHRLVYGDAAAHPQDDPFPLQFSLTHRSP
jgi:hypothetical protein